MYRVYRDNEVIGTFHSMASATMYLESMLECWEETSTIYKIVLDK